MEYMNKWRMSFREKQIASLRISYRGGYTGYFAQQVKRMLGMGFTVDQLKAESVDDVMRKWIDNAVPQVREGTT